MEGRIRKGRLARALRHWADQVGGQSGSAASTPAAAAMAVLLASGTVWSV
jgi:hypothetical protein